jgi:hypothetical protein
VSSIAGALARAGVVVVVEWDWERFDEATARWGFERAEAGGWLARRHEGWTASGQPWESYLRSWAEEHGIHRAQQLLAELDDRFEQVACNRGPYLFADLAHTTEEQERAAIEEGAISALRLDYVGRPAQANR